MPILRKESEIHPPGLFSLPLDAAPWQIVHVRSRQEKALARVLLDRDQPFYLPQIQKEFVSGGRKRTSFLPLFAGYVFVRSTPELRSTLWATNVVVRLIEVRDQERLLAELLQIRALQEAGATLVPMPDITVGDPVRISEGVFKGYIGTVVRERDETRLIVSITAVGKTVMAEFPRESVSATRGASARQLR